MIRKESVPVVATWRTSRRRQVIIDNYLDFFVIILQIISCESCTPEGVEALRPFIPEIWVQLSKHCQCAEEGSRNVVSIYVY